MAKIVKLGTKQDKTYEEECTKCGCVFIYKKEELKEVDNSDYYESTINIIKCPQCGEIVYIGTPVESKYSYDDTECITNTNDDLAPCIHCGPAVRASCCGCPDWEAWKIRQEEKKNG